MKMLKKISLIIAIIAIPTIMYAQPGPNNGGYDVGGGVVGCASYSITLTTTPFLTIAYFIHNTP